MNNTCELPSECALYSFLDLTLIAFSLSSLYSSCTDLLISWREICSLTSEPLHRLFFFLEIPHTCQVLANWRQRFNPGWVVSSLGRSSLNSTKIESDVLPIRLHSATSFLSANRFFSDHLFSWYLAYETGEGLLPVQSHSQHQAQWLSRHSFSHITIMHQKRFVFVNCFHHQIWNYYTGRPLFFFFSTLKSGSHPQKFGNHCSNPEVPQKRPKGLIQPADGMVWPARCSRCLWMWTFFPGGVCSAGTRGSLFPLSGIHLFPH